MTVRTLPIRLAPIPGEGLDSYLEALAHRAGVVWADMLSAVGLDPARRDSSGMYQWLTALTDTQADGVSAACGVSSSGVHAMTIGQAIPAGLAMIPGRSRFCPHCLEERDGRWQLWWRQRWAFACTGHHCLLVDLCPRCGHRPRARPRRGDQIPDPALCIGLADTAQNRGRRRCGLLLSTAPTLHLGAQHRALTAQSTIVSATRHGVITNGVYRGTPVTAQQFLTDIAELSRRMHRGAGLTEIGHALPADLVHHHRSPAPSGTPYRDDAVLPGVTASSVAIAAVLATEILLCPDIASAGAALRPWIAVAHDHGQRPTASSAMRTIHVSNALRGVQLCAMAPFLAPQAQLRHHTLVSAGPYVGVASPRWRQVPAAMWPGLTHYFPAIPGIGSERWEAALSVAVCLVGTPATLPEVVACLGSATTAASVSRILRALRADQRWPDFVATVTSLAEELDARPSPINYAARRTLPFAELIPRPQWRKILSAATMSVAPDVAYRLAQSWVYAQITGSPPRQCPTAPDTAEFRRSVTALPVLVSAELSSTLEQVARTFLNAHGHGHEPLRWQPGHSMGGRRHRGRGDGVKLT